MKSAQRDAITRFGRLGQGLLELLAHGGPSLGVALAQLIQQAIAHRLLDTRQIGSPQGRGGQRCAGTGVHPRRQHRPRCPTSFNHHHLQAISQGKVERALCFVGQRLHPLAKQTALIHAGQKSVGQRHQPWPQGVTVARDRQTHQPQHAQRRRQPDHRWARDPGEGGELCRTQAQCLRVKAMQQFHAAFQRTDGVRAADLRSLLTGHVQAREQTTFKRRLRVLSPGAAGRHPVPGARPAAHQQPPPGAVRPGLPPTPPPRRQPGP